MNHIIVFRGIELIKIFEGIITLRDNGFKVFAIFFIVAS